MRICVFFLLIIGTTAFFPLWSAQNFSHLAPSGLEKYRIDSQYGPEIAVLNPLFPKNEKLEISVGGNISAMSSLMNNFGLSASAVYHFNRRHAVEPLWFQYQVGQSLTAFVESEIRDKSKKAGVTNADLGVEIPKMTFGASYLFTPYYNKMHLTETSVLHVDMYMGLGPIFVKTEELLLNDQKGKEESRIGGAAILGFRLIFPPRWGLRIELRDLIYPSRNIGSDEVVNNLQINAGLSIFFDSFPDYTSL